MRHGLLCPDQTSPTQFAKRKPIRFAAFAAVEQGADCWAGLATSTMNYSDLPSFGSTVGSLIRVKNEANAEMRCDLAAGAAMHSRRFVRGPLFALRSM